MPVQEALEQIEAAQKEGKTPEQLLSLIESLHASFLEGDPEERAAFEEALLTVADGLYLPHLFWMYLAGFLEDREAYRPSLEALLRTFATLPPQSHCRRQPPTPPLCLFLRGRALSPRAALAPPCARSYPRKAGLLPARQDPHRTQSPNRAHLPGKVPPLKAVLP